VRIGLERDDLTERSENHVAFKRKGIAGGICRAAAPLFRQDQLVTVREPQAVKTARVLNHDLALFAE
jgi:hypothetical protein